MAFRKAREVNVTQKLSGQSHAKRLDISHLSALRYNSTGDSVEMRLLSCRPAVKDLTDNLLTVLVINKRAGSGKKHQQHKCYNLKGVFSFKSDIQFAARFHSRFGLDN